MIANYNSFQIVQYKDFNRIDFGKKMLIRNNAIGYTATAALVKCFVGFLHGKKPSDYFIYPDISQYDDKEIVPDDGFVCTFYDIYCRRFPDFVRPNKINQKTIDEIKEFVRKIQKQAEESNIENKKFVVETKIDGLTASLEYKNGIFVRGSTRGNGLVGEDVTENLKTIKNIPNKLSENIDITVRGEVFISSKDFEEMNLKREEEGLETFANARNAAAGSLRQLDSNITKTRPLDIYVYNIQKISGKELL